MTYYLYTAQLVRSFCNVGPYLLIAVCMLSHAQLDLDLGFTSFWLRIILIFAKVQNQRFVTLIHNADPKRRSREYCLCFPREEDDFKSMHCALFEAIVRAQVNLKGVYHDVIYNVATCGICVHANTRDQRIASNHDRKRTFLACVHAYVAKAESAF